MQNQFGCAALALAMAAGWMVSGAQAQTCGGSYVVQPRDTLSDISFRAYGTNRKWRVIYNHNYKIIGANPVFISPGQKLAIPCTNGKAPAFARVKRPASRKSTRVAALNKIVSAAVPLVVAVRKKTRSAGLAGMDKIKLLTAGDYKPFTDKKLPAGGMITEIVTTALENKPDNVQSPQAEIAWVNDWAAHLDPLLVNKAFDMGFPWFRPDCGHYDQLDKPAKFRCDSFLFSKPVFEILVVFFKQKSSSFAFNSDGDVLGKTFCRPSGYFTFDLDKDGRNWVKDKKITLVRPQSVEACFEKLDKGEIDAVVLNEFTGRAAVKKLAMNDRIEVLSRPVSILSLHVIVAKTHAKAKALLKHINDGLARIRSDGRYGAIVEKHLSSFWQGQS